MRRLFIRLIALLCVVAVLTDASFAPSTSSGARAQVRATYNEGAVGLGLALRRLQTTASVLHTGAHPDDEDSALIARLARGDGARVAYLSLNRGEGGQNRIGAELFDALGVIRTEELLQARRLDGGEQFFTRAFDFGFTKTREETAGRWNEREILEDMVRVIRRFRPLVVVSRWQGTPADGHGQHQFAGYLTPLALRAAADSRAFPEQLKEGLDAWQVRKFYVSHFGQAAAVAAGAGQETAGVLEIDTGRFDPLLGRSFYELAMEGRSQHKSQGEAALELRGAQTSRVKLLGVTNDPARPLEARTGEPERTIYDGLDTSVKGIAQAVGLKDKAVTDALAVIHQDAADALEKYSPHDLRPTVKALSDGLTRTRALYSRLIERLHAGELNPELVRARTEAAFLLLRKEREFRDALQLALGVRVDALADAETAAPGGSFVVAVRAFLPDDAARVQELRLRAPAGWRVERLSQLAKNETAFVARETAQQVAYFRVHVPADAEPTQPYWLSPHKTTETQRSGVTHVTMETRRSGDMYIWHEGDPKTEAFAPPLLVGEVAFEAGASQQVVSVPVEHRYLDAVRGEVRRELNVVPKLTFKLDPPLVIVPLGARERTRQVTLQLVNNVEPAAAATRADNLIATGETGIAVPEGWPRPRATAFRFTSKGESLTMPYDITVPRSVKPGAYALRSSINGNLYTQLQRQPGSPSPLGFSRTQRVIGYPHIRTHYYYTDAETTVHVFDLEVAPVRVGYIMGSGDEVPEAIRRMGLDVTMLDETQLSAGDLSRFDTIVVGVRASQTRPDFVSHHARLLEFVRRGGALIVQYQRPDYAAKKLPPLPASMDVPPQRAGASPTIARVVDERAPVRVLAPAHPAFNFPNRINEADWQGWVQERNLYNFTTFDPAYTPLLESHDAGESEQNGGQVYAKIGRGHYIYTSYAWFRQLPAGVPGAYRLFANLLSLPKAATQNSRTATSGARN